MYCTSPSCRPPPPTLPTYPQSIMLKTTCTLLLVLCVTGEVPPPSSNEPFEYSSFSDTFSDVVESYKARAVHAVSDDVAKYMDSIGVTAVVHDVLESHTAQYLNKTAEGIEAMIAHLSSTDMPRLESRISGLEESLSGTLSALAGLTDAVKHAGTFVNADRSGEAQSGTIGDVVVVTAGLGLKAAGTKVVVGGEEVAASASAGFHFQFGVDVATGKDAVVALGGGASVGMGVEDTTTTTKTKTKTKTDTGLLERLDADLDATLSVDFTSSTAAVSGFAYKVSIRLPSFTHIKSIHVHLRHPNWGCLSVNPKAMFEPTMIGWGMTLYEGAPSGLLSGAKGLWAELKLAAAEVAALKGSAWGKGTYMIGDSLTLGTASIPKFDSAACWVGHSSTHNAAGVVVHDAVGKVTDMVAFLEATETMVLKAHYTVPFCLGSCSGKVSTASSISGNATLKFTDDHDGGEVDIYVDGVTFGGTASVLAATLPTAAKNVFLGMLTPISHLGLGASSIKVVVTKETAKLTAAGSPALPTDTKSSAFEAVLRTISDAEVEIKASKSSEVATFELDIGTKPTDGSKIAIRSEDGKEGFTLFAKAATSGELDVGVSLPVRLCVEHCGTSSARFLYLLGDLEVSLSGEEQVVEGGLVMDGWWSEAFGIPFVNIADIKLGLAMNLETMVPTKLDIGGTVCLGTWSDCEHKTGTYIEARAYVGLDIDAPEKSYYITMVSKLTVGEIFGLIGEYSPFVKKLDIARNAPFLAESGIYPFSPDAACSTTATATDTPPASVDLSCYAYMSFNGEGSAKTISFRDGDVVIPNGIAFSGKIDFFGWKFGVQASVSESAFDIKAEMDKVDIKIGATSIIEIGKYLDGSEVKGGATFHVAADSKKGDILVGVYGAFSIPVLRSYGELQLTLDKSTFRFETDMHLFDGALTSKTLVEWNWDLTYFKAELSDISFADIIVVKDVHFSYDEKASSVDFGVKISVLRLISIAAELRITGNTIAFDVSADLALIAIDVSGTAQIATPFSDSSFHLHVKIEPGGVAKEIGKVAKAAVEAIGKAAVAVWDGLKKGVEVAVAAVKHVFATALKYLAKGFDAMVHGLEDVVHFLEKIPILGDLLKDIGHAISQVWNSAFGSTSSSHIVTESHRNEYGCRYQYVRTKTCHHFLFFTTSCHYHNGARYADKLCMVEVGINAQKVRLQSLKAQLLQGHLKASQARNKGLHDFVKGATLPDPVVEPYVADFPMHATMPVEFPAKVTLPKLTSNGIEHGQAMHSSVKLDLSSEDSLHASSTSGTAGLAKHAATFVSNHEGNSGEMSSSERSRIQREISEAMQKLQEYVGEEVTLVRHHISSHSEAALGRDATLLAANVTDDGDGDDADADAEDFFPVLTPPVLAHTNPVSISECTDVDEALDAQKPQFEYIDKHCRGKDAFVFLAGIEMADSFDTCRYAAKEQVTWRGVDACGEEGVPLTTTLYRTHTAPVFVQVPGLYTAASLTEDVSPRVAGQAGAYSPCGNDVDISYTDSTVRQGVGAFWVLERTWTASLRLPGCSEVPSVSQTQTIVIGMSGAVAASVPQLRLGDASANTPVRVAFRSGGYLELEDSVVHAVWCMKQGGDVWGFSSGGCHLGVGDGGRLVCVGGDDAGAKIVLAEGGRKDMGGATAEFLHMQVGEWCVGVDPSTAVVALMSCTSPHSDLSLEVQDKVGSC